MGLFAEVSSDVIAGWIKSEVPIDKVTDLERSAQENIIKNLFGGSLLRSVSRRIDFLYNCDDEKFLNVCSIFGLETNSNLRYDLAVEIASKTWSENSRLASVLRNVFDIEDEFMPVTESSHDSVALIEPVKPIPPAYEFQLEVIDKLKDFLASNQKAALLQLPTGAGKTRVTIQAIVESLSNESAKYDSFLWLAHTQELCDQAYETFQRMWTSHGKKPIKAYRLWGSKNAKINPTQATAIFASFGSYKKLASDEHFSNLLNKFTCVVIDEAHRAPSRVFGKEISDIKGEVKLLGLTATPGRHAEFDAENVALKQLFNSTLITSSLLGSNPIKQLQKLGILAKPMIQPISGSDQEIYAKSSGDISSATLNALGSNEKRNEIIVSKITDLVEEKKKILVFSCSVEHSKIIVANLAAAGIPASYVDAKMSNQRRMNVIDAFSTGKCKVLVNFGILSTGFDVPDISAVVITRPTSSIVLYSQMLGRGMRGLQAGGSADFLVLDIRDNFDSFGEVDEVYNYFEGLWV